VDLRLSPETARLQVRDDGVGGAGRRTGSGLIGLTDRVHALGGSLEVRSPVGEGTSLDVRIPISSSADQTT
jgi:signal transduction histidine kinase